MAGTDGRRADGRRVKMDVDTWVVLACTVGMFVVGVLLLAGVI